MILDNVKTSNFTQKFRSEFCRFVNPFKLNDMKNLAFLIFLLFSLCAFGQGNTEAKKAPFFTYNCVDSVSINKDKSIIQLFGDASFKTDLLEVTHADKIVFNNATKEVLVSSKFDYITKCALNLNDGSKSKTLRYKIGDDAVYLD